MSDKLFCGDCLSTDQQHAIWEACPQTLVAGILTAASDYIAAIREQHANEVSRAVEMSVHRDRLAKCERSFRKNPTPERQS